jgi:hypothetical protein
MIDDFRLLIFELPERALSSSSQSKIQNQQSSFGNLFFFLPLHPDSL